MSDQKANVTGGLSSTELGNRYRHGATLMQLAELDGRSIVTVRAKIMEVMPYREYRSISGHRAGRPRRRVTRKCATCGKPVERCPSLAMGRNVYCSADCMRKGFQQGETVACAYCGEKLYRPPHAIKRYRHNFCSGSCASKYYKREAGILPQREVTCEVCGKRFFRNESNLKGVEHHYCSTECAGVGKQDKIDVTCVVCGAAIQVVPSQYLDWIQHFCSQECRFKYMRMAVNRREDEALALCEKMEFYLRDRRTDRPDQFWKIVRQLARRTELLVSRPQDLTEGTRQRIARVFGEIKKAQSEQERTDVWHLQH